MDQGSDREATRLQSVASVPVWGAFYLQAGALLVCVEQYLAEGDKGYNRPSLEGTAKALRDLFNSMPERIADGPGK